MATPLPFNINWYLQQNPDVAQAVQAGLINAQTHFQLFGRAEGRNASPLFNSQQYLNDNPDVAQAVLAGLITAWDHFELFGGAEGRSPTPLFDEQFYLQQNPDVALAITNGMIQSAAQHFVLFGQGEPRAINPAIDLGKYLNSNPDLGEAATNGVINAFDHLMQFGINEGRDLGNGVKLSDFSSDPKFAESLTNGLIEQALNRVKEVAPFIPSFERPAGWTPPANTPIPVDFVPPAGSGVKLVIPAEVVVPDSVELPDTIFDLPVVPGGTGGAGSPPAQDTTPASLVSVSGNFFSGSNKDKTDYEQGDVITFTFSEKVKATSILEATLTVDNATLGEHSSIKALDLSGEYATTFAIELGANTTIDEGRSISIDKEDVIDTANNSPLDAITIDVPALAKANLVLPEENSTTMSGTAGNDVFVIVGAIAARQYDYDDVLWADTTIQNDIVQTETTTSSATGITSVNPNGSGYDVLHVYGIANLRGVDVSNISQVYLHSDVEFTESQLASFTEGTRIIGDGSSTLRIANSDAESVDLSRLGLENLAQLDIGDNVSAIMSQTNLGAVKTVSSGFSNAKIQAAAKATLDFASKSLFGGAAYLESDGATTNKTTESANDIGTIIDTINGKVIEPVNALLGVTGYINGTPTSDDNAPLKNYWQTLAAKETYELMCDDLAGGSILLGREGVQNFISGGTKADTIYGAQNTTNFIYGGAGEVTEVVNTIYGGGVRDFIAGGDKVDVISAGAGNDFVASDTANDTGDNDIIRGGAGDDFINTGLGKDRLIFEQDLKGNGTDFIDATSLTSGENGDIFDFTSAHSNYQFTGVNNGTVTLFRSADTTNANAEIAGLSVLADQSVIIFSHSVGLDTDLETALAVLDTNPTGNRLIVWNINDSSVGIGVLFNPSEDKNDLDVLPFAILGGFTGDTQASTYLAGLTSANFDVIGFTETLPQLYDLLTTVR